MNSRRKQSVANVVLDGLVRVLSGLRGHPSPVTGYRFHLSGHTTREMSPLSSGMTTEKKWRVHFVSLFLPLLMLSAVFFVCLPAEAEDLLGIEYGQYSGLSDTDPRVTVPRIINAILGLLGTVATALIVYSGFLWLTSAGNEDKITTAKKILWTSAVGLIIIMMSYAITRYVVREGYQATTGGRYENNQFGPIN